MLCAGYKFDEKENVKRNEERKLQKSTLGLQDSDDEAEEAEEVVTLWNLISIQLIDCWKKL